MGANTAIEWTDATWNPVGGCSIKSKGCTHCYAQRMAGTRLASHKLYAGTTSPSKAGPVFNGHLTAAPDDDRVWTWPLRWRGPKVPRRGFGARPMVFVGDMSDLFHEDRPDAVIDRVFAVMSLAGHVDFQVLTKRPERMRDYLLGVAADQKLGLNRFGIVAAAIGLCGPDGEKPCSPLPNVWLGVSAEDQTTADERVPIVLDTPAAVRFVSAEPLLGPIDFRGLGIARDIHHHPDNDLSTPERRAALADIVRAASRQLGPTIDWIITGGESGPKARPMHPDWPRSIRDQCHAAGTAFFFKQWGEFGPAFDHALQPTGHPWNGEAQTAVANGTAMIEQATRRLGKARAGRLLDGREWNEFPRIAA